MLAIVCLQDILNEYTNFQNIVVERFRHDFFLIF